MLNGMSKVNNSCGMVFMKGFFMTVDTIRCSGDGIFPSVHIAYGFGAVICSSFTCAIGFNMLLYLSDICGFLQMSVSQREGQCVSEATRKQGVC